MSFLSTSQGLMRRVQRIRNEVGAAPDTSLVMHCQTLATPAASEAGNGVSAEQPGWILVRERLCNSLPMPQDRQDLNKHLL